MERELWRLLVDGAGSAAWNMAVDEAILEAVASGEQPPTLRLYRWEPPAVSIGYFQEMAEAVNEAACRREGVEVVRRPTGGRAVFHDQELTYSVALPPGHPVAAGGILDSYRRLSLGLQEGLRRLGVQAELATPPAAGRGPGASACFDSASRHELEWAGRKLVGSAQTRRASGALLQHGSILLRFDPLRAAMFLSPDPATAGQLARVLAARAAGLEEAAGRPVSWEEAARAVAEGLAVALGIRWAPGGLSPGEQRRAGELVAGRYGTDAWNRHRPGRVRAGVSP
ncbi:MAG TPA: lipoate--protein ligase family protein [Limnochordales bacterium]